MFASASCHGVFDQNSYSYSVRLLTWIARTLGPQRALLAHSVELRECCYRLVYKEYVARGLCTENTQRSYCTSYAARASSRTFALPLSTGLGGTLTLVSEDGGLPLEALFGDEIAERRRHGTRLAEVSMLALDSHLIPRRQHSLRSIQKMRALFSLFAAMHCYCTHTGQIDELAIVVHPRHASIYKLLGFNAFGPVKSYDSVQGKPALPLIARVEDIAEFVRQHRLESFVRNALFNEIGERLAA